MTISCEQDIEDFISGKTELCNNGHWYSEDSVKYIESTVNFYGFHPKDIYHKVDSTLNLSKLTMDGNGRWRINPTNCHEYKHHEFYLEITFWGNIDWTSLIAKPYNLGFEPKQHMLCLNYGSSSWYGRICMIYKQCGLQKYCNRNPLPCPYYVLNQKKLKDAIEEYEKIIGDIVDEYKH